MSRPVAGVCGRMGTTRAQRASHHRMCDSPICESCYSQLLQTQLTLHAWYLLGRHMHAQTATCWPLCILPVILYAHTRLTAATCAPHKYIVGCWPQFVRSAVWLMAIVVCQCATVRCMPTWPPAQPDRLPACVPACTNLWTDDVERHHSNPHLSVWSEEVLSSP